MLLEKLERLRTLEAQAAHAAEASAEARVFADATTFATRAATYRNEEQLLKADIEDEVGMPVEVFTAQMRFLFAPVEGTVA